MRVLLIFALIVIASVKAVENDKVADTSTDGYEDQSTQCNHFANYVNSKGDTCNCHFRSTSARCISASGATKSIPTYEAKNTMCKYRSGKGGGLKSYVDSKGNTCLCGFRGFAQCSGVTDGNKKPTESPTTPTAASTTTTTTTTTTKATVKPQEPESVEVEVHLETTTKEPEQDSTTEPTTPTAIIMNTETTPDADSKTQI